MLILTMKQLRFVAETKLGVRNKQGQVMQSESKVLVIEYLQYLGVVMEIW